MKRVSTLVWPVALLVAVLVFNLVFTPGFLHIEVRDGRLFGSMIDILNRAAPVLILALGMTLVIGTAGVDLSVGAVMAIAGTIAAGMIARPDGFALNFLPGGSSFVAVCGFGLLAALLCGMFNGVLVAYFRIQPIVATLLLMVAGRGIAQLLAQGQIIVFENAPFHALGGGATLGFPNPIWIFAITASILVLATRATAFGLFVEAVGANPKASAYSGLRSTSILIAVYAISGLCAGIAGLIAASDIKAADANNAGLYLELDAILAVAIGGTSLAGGRFSIAGSIIGAILMQTLTTTLLTRGVAPEATLILKALIVVLVCLLQSDRFGSLLGSKK